MSGSLVVVGAGIGFARITLEARAAIAAADEVLYLVPDPVSATGIEALNPAARSLHDFYEEGASHHAAYERMTEAILEPVRAGKRVCAAFYGHPGVFVLPSHEAVSRARAEGFDASMQPGVSAEDCLVADLGVDPGVNGLQSYEAGDFLRRRPATEPTTALVLWQIGVVGARTHTANVAAPALPELVELLLARYPAGHQAVVYEASSYPGVAPTIRDLRLDELGADTSTSRQRCTCRQFLAECARPAGCNHVPLRLEELLRVGGGRPSSVSPAAACASASASSASAAKDRRVSGAGELDGGRADLLRLPAAAELGERLRARDTPRNLRVDIVGRRSSRS